MQDGGVLCGAFLYTFDMDAVAESFLLTYDGGSGGAIAYLGERVGGQATIVDLDRAFFAAYSAGHYVLGDMWKYMIEQYYAQHGLANSHTWSIDDSQWPVGHMFDEPHKLVVFGDPSLVVGGAFTSARSGNVWDSIFAGGPWWSYLRYRITGDVTVPTGQTLTAYPAASVFFEVSKKITAMDSDPGKGFRVNGTADEPVWFLSLPADPQSEHVAEGVRVSGQLRIRNGGQIKLY